MLVCGGDSLGWTNQELSRNQKLEILNRGQRGRVLALLSTCNGSHIKELCNKGIPQVSVKSSLKELISLGLIIERYFIYSITEEGKKLSTEIKKDPLIRIWLEQISTFRDLKRPRVEYLE